MRRDNAATSDGLATLRYGSADVLGIPCEVALEVAHNLMLRGWPASDPGDTPQPRVRFSAATAAAEWPEHLRGGFGPSSARNHHARFALRLTNTSNAMQMISIPVALTNRLRPKSRARMCMVIAIRK